MRPDERVQYSLASVELQENQSKERELPDSLTYLYSFNSVRKAMMRNMLTNINEESNFTNKSIEFVRINDFSTRFEFFTMGNQQSFLSYNTWDLNAYSQMTGLSPAQIQQLQMAFNQQTATTGGRMTISQFKNLYASMAGLSWNFDVNAEQMFLMFDRDGNGVLTFDEFLMGYLMLQRGVNPVQRWTYATSGYPLSRPGYLSAAEAQMLLNNMQRFYNFPMQETYFNTAWSQMGVGMNDYVPVTQFVQAIIPLIPQTYIW